MQLPLTLGAGRYSADSSAKTRLDEVMNISREINQVSIQEIWGFTAALLAPKVFSRAELGERYKATFPQQHSLVRALVVCTGIGHDDEY